MKKYMVLMGILLSMTVLFVSYSWGQNHAPTATAGNRSIYAGTSPAFVPWVEDPDLGDTFIYQILSPATPYGTPAVVNNKLVYTPNSGFTGPDNFPYNVTDQGGGGATITGIAKVRVYGEGAYSICTRVSVVNTDGTLTLTRSNRCTFYTITDTRVTDAGAPVTMDYFINWPSNGSAPKALVVLIGGHDLNMNFTGDTTTGVADANTGGGNFVVRTAQLFADDGYATVAINRPSDLPLNSIADADKYRTSVKHAVDILTVLKHVNTENLDIFLAGTSRGAMSAVASNLIAAGVSLSSPLTSDTDTTHLYIGRSDIANLLPSFVRRPAHVLWHQNDGCSLSKPADAQALCTSLSNYTTTSCNDVSGGVVDNTRDECGHFHYHGYFGMETTAVSYITNWLNAQVQVLTSGDNKRPQAAFAEVTTPPGVSKQIDLATLTTGQDRVYALSHTETSLEGSSVTLNGPTVTYTPPAGVNNKTDYFVYVVTDGNGRIGAGVITVRIGIPPAPPSGLRIIP